MIDVFLASLGHRPDLSPTAPTSRVRATVISANLLAREALYTKIHRATVQGRLAWYLGRQSAIVKALRWLGRSNAWATKVRAFVEDVEAYLPEKGRSEEGWESMEEMQKWNTKMIKQAIGESAQDLAY